MHLSDHAVHSQGGLVCQSEVGDPQGLRGATARRHRKFFLRRAGGLRPVLERFPAPLGSAARPYGSLPSPATPSATRSGAEFLRSVTFGATANGTLRCSLGTSGSPEPQSAAVPATASQGMKAAVADANPRGECLGFSPLRTGPGPDWAGRAAATGNNSLGTPVPVCDLTKGTHVQEGWGRTGPAQGCTARRWRRANTPRSRALNQPLPSLESPGPAALPPRGRTRPCYSNCMVARRATEFREFRCPGWTTMESSCCCAATRASSGICWSASWAASSTTCWTGRP